MTTHLIDTDVAGGAQVAASGRSENGRSETGRSDGRDGTVSAVTAPAPSPGERQARPQRAARRRSDQLVGTSRAILRAREQLAVAGRGRFPVWLRAERGVDKEAIARMIHDQSTWTQGGFFALDASIVSTALLARELFGSTGSGAGALAPPYEGALSRYAGGTVLIDSIESLPKELQIQLANAIARGEIQAVGSTAVYPLECRVIAASTFALDDLIADGRVVPELSERLRLLEIHIPPLRERREDILPIAAHELAVRAAELQHETGRPCPVRGFSREALEQLRDHGWPEDERELREQIRAAVSLARGEELGPEDLLLSWDSSDQIPAFREAKRTFEFEYVTRLLRLCDGNISRAARIAKKDRKDFYDVMRRNGIDPTDYRG